MKNYYVIKNSNLPARFPLLHTVVWLFLLDYYKAPGWAWGVLCTIYAILWAGCIYAKFKQTEIDIFVMAVEPETMKVDKSKFQERVEQALKEREKNKTI